MISLPDEILEEIFFRATAAAEREDDPTLPLKSINLVSRSWHSTFLSSPRLWRNIGYVHVDMHNCSMDDSKPDTEGPFLQGLTRHLSRAKSQPLAFSFDAGWTHITRVVATAGRALAVLSKHASQWQSVELTIHAAVIHALDGIDGNLPQLEQLTLDMQGTDPPPRLNHFAVAPRLSSVRIQFVGYYSEPDILVLPWSQLVEYQANVLGSLHEKGFHAVLTTSPQLQTVASPYDFHPNTYFLDAPFYRHTTLTRLRLNFNFPGSSCILRRLVLPGLLALRVAARVQETLYSDIAALISQSECLLTALAVLPTNQSLSFGGLDRQFTRVLALCPTLEYLCLEGFPWLEDVRELMCFDEEGGVRAPKLVPELQRLDIRRNMKFLPRLLDEDFIALNALAKSREDMYRRGVAKHLLEIHVESVESITEERSLKNLRLLDYPGLAPERDLLELRKWAEALKVALGEEAEEEPTYMGFWSCCLKGALREMAAYNVERSNVACLYVLLKLMSPPYHADIPCLLERVALLPPSDFPFGLIARARRILERWKPDLIQNAKASRFWIRKGRENFEYVHLTSPRRVQDGLAWEIVVSVPGKAVLRRRRLERAFE
ncbi:hypothetical protein DFP72DRAFT_905527 [Ephemerocybe angulata]|uniref:F-box domain-containing protein n=1 Tax=Ephemerocybe angulata TaxID=980116 RepID=A0A8H6M3Y0_9AGAR|nr:hypothetical protein DFP72DRAFT_905527 [Tulosesus angulatus]